MPGPTAVIAPRYIPTSTDFHDSPVGHLGKRAVAIGYCEAPRVASPGIGDRLKNLLARMADALTPSGVRAEGKFQRGLQDFSAKVGDTLGALLPNAKNGAMNENRFFDCLLELRGAAEPCVRRGHAFNDLLTARLNTHLSKLDAPTLLYLEEKMQSQALRVRVSPAHQLQQEALDGIANAFGGDLRMDATLKTDFDTLASVIGNHLDRLQAKAFVEHFETLKDHDETLRVLVTAHQQGDIDSLGKMLRIAERESSSVAAFANRADYSRIDVFRQAIARKASALITPRETEALERASKAQFDLAGQLVTALSKPDLEAVKQAASEFGQIARPAGWTNKDSLERFQTALETQLSNLRNHQGRKPYEHALQEARKLKPLAENAGSGLQTVIRALLAAIDTHNFTRRP